MYQVSSEDNIPNKWRGYLVIFGGVLIHLTLGTVYTFGNMTPYITSYMKFYDVAPDLTYAESIWIYAASYMGHGSAVFLGGIIHRKLGTRLTTLLGSWISSAGVFITYFTVQKSFPLTVLTYGAMFGVGVGIAYATPMSCGMKWLPHRKGLVNGLVVGGFGGGALIFDQVQTAYINPSNIKADKTVGDNKFFDKAEILDKVPSTFLVLGGCYAAMQLIGVLLIKDPPEKKTNKKDIPMVSIVEISSDNKTYEDQKTSRDNQTSNERRASIQQESNTEQQKEQKQSGEQNTKGEEVATSGGKKSSKSSSVQQKSTKPSTEQTVPNLTPTQVLKKKSFYMLWFLFFFNGQAIQFISTLYKTYGQTFIKDDRFLAIVGSLAAICNGGGRIIWGYIADRYCFKIASMWSMGVYCVCMLTFSVTERVGKSLFLIYVCLLFLAFSGNFSLLPTAAAKSFGVKHYSINYGMVFTATVVTCPIGVLLTSSLQNSLGWYGMFFLVAGFSFVSVLISIFFDKKRPDGKDI